MTLEDKLIQDLKAGKEVSIERALLIVSGCDTEEQVSDYTAKLNRIQQDFKICLDVAMGYDWQSLMQEQTSQYRLEKPSEFLTAAFLFRYLWETKPNRYNSNFLLTDVIDAQLSEDRNQRVGDCVGLTSLYTVLGLRNELDMAVLINPDHVLSVLKLNGRKIPVENTKRDGFNFCDNPENYSEEDLITLVASVINRKGIAKRRSGDIKGAIVEYNKAIDIKPDFAWAFNNRGFAKAKLGDLEGAISDYDKAIDIKPDYAQVFNGRGITKDLNGDLEGAMDDYNKSIDIKPDYAEAFYNRGSLKEKQGNLSGAMSDYRQAFELKPEKYVTLGLYVPYLRLKMNVSNLLCKLK